MGEVFRTVQDAGRWIISLDVRSATKHNLAFEHHSWTFRKLFVLEKFTIEKLLNYPLISESNFGQLCDILARFSAPPTINDLERSQIWRRMKR